MASTHSVEHSRGIQFLNLKIALALITGVLMLMNIYFIFMIAPTDAVLGHVQRVFYFHVPIAIMSFLAFFLVFIASLMYLFKRSTRWDSFAHASAEVGVIFVTLALITGIIWARPVWNTWWTWEPRLTTTLILWLIYVAYLMVRSYAPTQSKGAIYAAVVGIIGFVDVPIVYYSVVWWRSIHPSPVVGPFAQSDALDGTMALILLYSLVTFVFFFAYIVMERMELKTSEESLGRIRFALRQRGQ